MKLNGALRLQAASTLHCQVWAVSHSDAFHACCDTFLKVSKGAEGTGVEVLEATSYRGSAGANRVSAGAQKLTAGQFRASAWPGKPPLGAKRTGIEGDGERWQNSAPKRKVGRRS